MAKGKGWKMGIKYVPSMHEIMVGGISKEPSECTSIEAMILASGSTLPLSVVGGREKTPSTSDT